MKLPHISRLGFTLTEILVSVTLVTILATIGFTLYSSAQVVGRDSRRKQDLQAIASALEIFYQDNKRYPCSKPTAAVGDNNGWETSADTNWLYDLSPCTGVGTKTSIAPTFINLMPKDPKSNSTSAPTGANQFGYAYYSPDIANGTCTKGQYYLLITQLENSKDQDITWTKYGSPATWKCGTLAATNFSASQYIIFSP